MLILYIFISGKKFQHKRVSHYEEKPKYEAQNFLRLQISTSSEFTFALVKENFINFSRALSLFSQKIKKMYHRFFEEYIFM